MFEEVPMGHLTTLQHWDTTEVDLEDWQVNLANECLKTIQDANLTGCVRKLLNPARMNTMLFRAER